LGKHLLSGHTFHVVNLRGVLLDSGDELVLVVGGLWGIFGG